MTAVSLCSCFLSVPRRIPQPLMLNWTGTQTNNLWVHFNEEPHYLLTQQTETVQLPPKCRNASTGSTEGEVYVRLRLNNTCSNKKSVKKLNVLFVAIMKQEKKITETKQNLSQWSCSTQMNRRDLCWSADSSARHWQKNHRQDFCPSTF